MKQKIGQLQKQHGNYKNSPAKYEEMHVALETKRLDLGLDPSQN